MLDFRALLYSETDLARMRIAVSCFAKRLSRYSSKEDIDQPLAKPGQKRPSDDMETSKLMQVGSTAY